MLFLLSSTKPFKVFLNVCKQFSENDFVAIIRQDFILLNFCPPFPSTQEPVGKFMSVGNLIADCDQSVQLWY